MEQSKSQEEREFDEWLINIVKFYSQFNLFNHIKSSSNLDIAQSIKESCSLWSGKSSELWKSLMTYEGLIFPFFQRCWGYCLDNPPLDFEIREYTGTYKYILNECSKISQNLFVIKDIKEIWADNSSSVKLEFTFKNKVHIIEIERDEICETETFIKLINKINPLVKKTGYQFFIIDEGAAVSILFIKPEEKKKIEQQREYVRFAN